MLNLLDRLRLASENALKLLARKAGIHVAWIPRDGNGWRSCSGAEGVSKIYVGSGPDYREGYLNCDVRRLPEVDLVCPAWQISDYTEGLDAVYSRHTLEHLTDMEARHALDDWYKSLKPGGTVEIVVPDIDFHLEQWRRAQWENEGPAFTKAEARWAFAGLFGWQHECDPATAEYNSTYWDVHKSGYNFERIRHLLEAAGFAEVTRIDTSREHLHVQAVKLTRKDERQVAPNLAGIRADHLARYELAASLLKPGDQVGDLACGVGYGAYVLATSASAPAVLAADIDEGAVKYALTFYAHPNIQYQRADVTSLQLEEGSFDLITCFETVEHVHESAALLDNLNRALKPGATLVISTPNEDVLPFKNFKNPYHVRHYTPREFEELLCCRGFKVTRRLTQTDRVPGNLRDGWHGMYNIAVCVKS
jgi:predicted SAM-dependent methyltransferase